MANNRNRYNQPTRILWNVLAALLILAVLAGGTLGMLEAFGKGNAKPSNWGKTDVELVQPADDDKDKDKDETAGGMFLEDGEATEGPMTISFLTTVIPREQYEDYGIMPIAESAQQIKATVTPANAEDKKIVWSIAWEDGTSGKFGEGKTVTDYVSGSASQDTLTYTLSCTQAFGEVIIVTAAIDGNDSVKATKKVQYQQKYADMSASVRFTHTTTQANVTWTFPAGTPSATAKFDFPGYATDFTQFKNMYSLTGSNKGQYNTTVAVTGSSVYTVAMKVTKQTVISKVVNIQYGGQLYKMGGKESASTTYEETVLGPSTGNGPVYTTMTEFDFLKFFRFDINYNLDLTRFKQFMASSSKANVTMLTFKITAEVNGKTEEKKYPMLWNETSIGTLAQNLDLGSGDITF